MNRRNVLKNTALVIISLVFAALLSIVAEAIVRITTDIPLLGHSANLFTPNVFATSMGNAKNTEAISFGVRVFTDADGFRVDRKQTPRGEWQYDRAIMVLGDSVGFGVGVEFQETFVVHLSAKDPRLRVYNTSVIGYGVEDYKNVTDVFLPTRRNEIDAVFLIFCLNDISNVSAANIGMAFTKKNANTDGAERNHFKHRTETKRNEIISNLKRLPSIARANEYLRSHSKLYLLVKGVITYPQARYWQADLRAFRQLKGERFATVLEPLRYISDLCRQHDISFTVIVVPYEYQVRVDDESTSLPQQVLADFFETHQIHYVDALPLFRNRSSHSADLFLRYDPMHLSSRGHHVLYEIVSGVLRHGEINTGDTH